MRNGLTEYFSDTLNTTLSPTRLILFKWFIAGEARVIVLLHQAVESKTANTVH